MVNKLNIAFFGTPDFASYVLEKIINYRHCDSNVTSEEAISSFQINVSAILTQPDKPIGRKQILTPSPVKIIGQKYQIPVFENLEEAKNSLKNIDLVLVFAYGKIIPTSFLAIPKNGFWNIHPSLLPKYRGPSPISYALINGDLETGVTLIKLDEKMDHGPIIDQQKYQILETDTRIDLENKLSEIGFQLFLKNVEKLVNNTIIYTPQDENEATFTKILTKDYGYIEINKLKEMLISDQFKLFNLFRGLIGWPGIWTKININNEEKRLKITSINFINEKLTIEKVQIEGKNEISFIDFNKNYSIF